MISGLSLFAAWALRRLPGRNDWVVGQLADKVACRCRPNLWQRVCRVTGTMSIPEIRGYVRARALPLVESEAAAALVGRRFWPRLRQPVVDAAVDRLIAMMIGDVLREEPAEAAKLIAA